MSFQRLNEDFIKARVILDDLLFKATADRTKKENISLLKLLKAREENLDFELELAERICGDNDNYPYRSSYYITKFFKDLGFSYEHDGSTRRYWIKNVLEQINIKDIGFIVENGLFREKDFTIQKFRSEANKDLPFEEFRYKAMNDFKQFIEKSCQTSEPIELSNLLQLNVSVELLFNSKPQTKDEILNSLIEDAKNRFLNSNDYLTAVEKLWDAFERIKTYFDQNKKQSAKKLIELMSINLDYDDIDQEFQSLTIIGNKYSIRHHETNKIQISDPREITYLFFRMLSLLELALGVLQDDEFWAESE